MLIPSLALVFAAMTFWGDWFKRKKPTPRPVPVPQKYLARLTVWGESGPLAAAKVTLRLDQFGEQRFTATADGPRWVFTLPENTNDRNGAHLSIEAEGYDSIDALPVLLTKELGDYTLDPAVKARAGSVVTVGRGFVDDTGPFYPLGTTMFYAAEHWRKGGEMRLIVQDNLTWLDPYGLDYTRVFWHCLWDGDKRIDSMAPGFPEAMGDFIDYAYQKHGLRTKITVTGGGALDVGASVARLNGVIAGRESRIFMVEAVNEGNASEEVALDIAKRIGPGVIVSTGRGDQGMAGIIALDNRLRTLTSNPVVSCFHPERGLGDPHEAGGPHARQVRQAWDSKEFPLAVEIGEPVGPKSSVATLDDPEQMAAFRAAQIVCGADAFCLHTGHGVYGVDNQGSTGFRNARFRDAAGLDAVFKAASDVDSILPPSMGSWARFNGGYGGPLIVEGTGTINKNYGARTANAFAQIVVGCRGQIDLRPLRPCSYRVYRFAPVTLLAGPVSNTVTVSGAWAYLIVGSM